MVDGRDHFERENSKNDENMDVEIEEPIDAQNQENVDSEDVFNLNIFLIIFRIYLLKFNEYQGGSY